MPEENERDRVPVGTRLSTGMRVLLGISIVMIVCALLVNYVPRAREQARRASCLGNLKQLGLALYQYRQDFKDCYPWQVGATSPAQAWRDLGMLYPFYNSGWQDFICPSSRDRALREREWQEAEPLAPWREPDLISFSYGMDARDPKRPVAWTEAAPSTVRILADKKAGVPLEKHSNHKLDGRNVLYHDGRAKWRSGEGALDPCEEDDTIGAPGAKDYRAWWSDPPYYGE